MSSPRLTDSQLKEQFGMRPKGQPLDYPQELGYICPKGHGGDYLTWSEFNEHIWCYKCNMDYHFALDCQLKRMCWMSDDIWNNFVNNLPQRPRVLDGIQHFYDCYIEVKPYKRSKAGLRNKTIFVNGYRRLRNHTTRIG